jgi:hypothetical protein
MAFVHGKNTAVYYNGSNLSSYFNEASMSQDVETAETTAFGDSAKTYITGLKDGTCSRTLSVRPPLMLRPSFRLV